MAGKRIVFTGGTGKAGRHAVPHLKAKGYEILNVDLKPLDSPGVNTLIADLTDSGQAFNALSRASRKARRPPRPTRSCISRRFRAC
jgi:nucleoside-diphosphate-sugar epimerase